MHVKGLIFTGADCGPRPAIRAPLSAVRPLRVQGGRACCSSSQVTAAVSEVAEAAQPQGVAESSSKPSTSASLQGEVPAAETAQSPSTVSEPSTSGTSTAVTGKQGARWKPAPGKSYYGWPRARRPLDRPQFLNLYPTPEDAKPNVISFLGSKDASNGNYVVARQDYDEFLQDYLEAYNNGYMLFLAERFLRDPFRYFVELDFDWSLDVEVVEAVTNRVIDIVVSSVRKLYKCKRNPRCLVSMRTPYKVHLNFPDVVTTEPLAYMCRDEVVVLCKQELGDAYPLDWDRIVDFPHGSLRLLGSRKARHMDRDPAWVHDKAYYPVTWKEEEQRWVPRGVFFRLLRDSSIIPTAAQLKAFEGSALFREMAYTDIDAWRLKLEDRQRRRLERLMAEGMLPGQWEDQTGERQGKVKVRLEEREDGSVSVVLRLRNWARKHEAVLQLQQQVQQSAQGAAPDCADGQHGAGDS